MAKAEPPPLNPVGCLVFLALCVFGAWILLVAPMPPRSAAARWLAPWQDWWASYPALKADVCVYGRPVPFPGNAITGDDGNTLTVDPTVWDRTPYAERVALARWISVCILDGHEVTIRHGNTGKSLATFSAWWGYSTNE